MEVKPRQHVIVFDNFPLNASRQLQPVADGLPEIVFPRVRNGLSEEATHGSKLVSVSESLRKRIFSTYMERGLLEVLVVARESTSPVVVATVNKLLSLCNWFRSWWTSAPSESTINIYTETSRTRNWSQSVIRGLAWHPHIFKLAVATIQDTVSIYSLDTSLTAILKCELQKSIMCLAWRPNAAGELAIGCENGVLIWNVDPTSQFSRQLVPPIVLHHVGQRYRHVSAISWSENGNLLLIANVGESCVYLWNVDFHRSEKLKFLYRCAMVEFGPAGYQFLVTTLAQQFCIANIKPRNKITQCWTLTSGSVQSFAWSKKHNHLLYVTTDKEELFHLQVGVTSSISASLVNLQRTKTKEGLDVGGHPQSIVWCPLDHVLAIAFKNTAVLAVFVTKVERCNFSIDPYCFITGIGMCYPCCIIFQENYNQYTRTAPQSVLTVGWSSGAVAYYLLKE